MNSLQLELPFLIDGGLSNVLEGQGCDLNHPLWTAKLLATAPEVIVRAHLKCLQAGARCIITSSYQASIENLFFRYLAYVFQDDQITMLFMSAD